MKDSNNDVLNKWTVDNLKIIHLSELTINKPSFNTKLLTNLGVATNQADSLSIATNNASKTGDAKCTSNAGKTGNIRGNGGGNTINSTLGGNERPEKTKKDANIIPAALIY